MKYLSYYQPRKTNHKKWICPLCLQDQNTSGAAGHLRNRHSIPWKSEYLSNPRLIKIRRDSIMDRPHKQVQDIFADYNYIDDDIPYRAIITLSKFATEIKFALTRNDELALIKLEAILIKSMREFIEYNSRRDDA